MLGRINKDKYLKSLLKFNGIFTTFLPISMLVKEAFRVEGVSAGLLKCLTF